MVPLTFQLHSHFETFLEATIRASFSLCFVNVTISVSNTGINFFVLDGALEEALAGFTGQKTVVISRDLIAANRAQLFNPFLGIRLILAKGCSVLQSARSYSR
jgi:hypothetical protein